MNKRILKLVDLKGKGINNWLFNLTPENVENIHGKDAFALYKPLDRGNDKLEDNILAFSLPPISTCGGEVCKGCFDLKAFRNPSVRAKRYVNLSMVQYHMTELEEMIFRQVKNSRTVKHVRIHVGGDFFSERYVEMWQRLARRIKEVKPFLNIYTYTKTGFTADLEAFGINVVQSEYDEGYNYGQEEYLLKVREKHDGVICPATALAHRNEPIPNKLCGSACTACMFKKNVFFYEH